MARASSIRNLFMLTMVICIAPAIAQSSLDKDIIGKFEPQSRTSMAITGPIKITPKSITFNGKTVKTSLQGKYWRVWGEETQKRSANVYTLERDPGTLLQGNTLCGANQARYAVVWPSFDETIGGSLQMAIYSSTESPQDSTSPGLCGTFSYVFE